MAPDLTSAGADTLHRELVRLAREKASGRCEIGTSHDEFVLELREGLVVWAQRSKAPDQFARFLLTTCGIAPGVLHAAVADAAAFRGRVADALVDHGAITDAELGAAIRTHVVAVLAAMQRAPRLTRFWFRKHTNRPSHGFAWPIADLWKSTADVAPGGGSGAHAWMLPALADLVPDALWLARVHESGLCDVHPPRAFVPIPLLADLHETLAREGGETLILRGSTGTLVGLREREGGGSIWCALDPEESTRPALDRLLGVVRMVASGAPWPTLPPVPEVDVTRSEIVGLASRLGRVLTRHRGQLTRQDGEGLLPAVGFMGLEVSLFGEPAPERPGTHRWCALPGGMTHDEAWDFFASGARET